MRHHLSHMQHDWACIFYAYSALASSTQYINTPDKKSEEFYGKKNSF